MDKIAQIEETVVDAAGFFASFVIKKQLVEMGETRESFPDAKLGQFIDAVVDNAVYDLKIKRDIKKKLKSKFEAFEYDMLPPVRLFKIKQKGFSRIDEIFMMTKAGILINHFSNETTSEIDEDILSGMLTAVQSFVTDSFQKKQTVLKELRMGDFNILIVQGEYLTVVIISPEENLKPLEEPVNAMIEQLEKINLDLLKQMGGMWEGTLVGADDCINRLVNPAA